MLREKKTPERNGELYQQILVDKTEYVNSSEDAEVFACIISNNTTEHVLHTS